MRYSLSSRNYRRMKSCVGATGLMGLSGSHIGAMISSSSTQPFSPFVLSKNMVDSVSAQSHMIMCVHTHTHKCIIETNIHIINKLAYIDNT